MKLKTNAEPSFVRVIIAQSFCLQQAVWIYWTVRCMARIMHVLGSICHGQRSTVQPTVGCVKVSTSILTSSQDLLRSIT